MQAILHHLKIYLIPLLSIYCSFSRSLALMLCFCKFWLMTNSGVNGLLHYTNSILLEEMSSEIGNVLQTFGANSFR